MENSDWACKNCIYANQYSSTFRECRRYPPPYHQTNEDWWCGEFKRRPAKAPLVYDKVEFINHQ